MIPKLQNLCYEDRLKRKQNAQFHAIKSTNVLLKTSKVAVYTAVLGLFKHDTTRQWIRLTRCSDHFQQRVKDKHAACMTALKHNDVNY